MNPYNEIQKVYQVKNGVKIYDFVKCVEVLEDIGRFHFGSQFKIYENDLPVIKKLIIYAIRDEVTATGMNININKVIMELIDSLWVIW